MNVMIKKVSIAIALLPFAMEAMYYSTNDNRYLRTADNWTIEVPLKYKDAFTKIWKVKKSSFTTPARALFIDNSIEQYNEFIKVIDTALISSTEDKINLYEHYVNKDSSLSEKISLFTLAYVLGVQPLCEISAISIYQQLKERKEKYSYNALKGSLSNVHQEGALLIEALPHDLKEYVHQLPFLSKKVGPLIIGYALKLYSKLERNIHLKRTILCAAFSPDSSYLAIGTSEGVGVWKKDTLFKGHTFFKTAHPIAHVLFNKNNVLAVSNQQGKVKIWSIIDKKKKGSIDLQDKIISLSWSSNGQFLAIGGEKSLNIWNSVFNKSSKVIGLENRRQIHGVFSPGNQNFFIVGSSSLFANTSGIQLYKYNASKQQLTLVEQISFLNSFNNKKCSEYLLDSLIQKLQFTNDNTFFIMTPLKKKKMFILEDRALNKEPFFKETHSHPSFLTKGIINERMGIYIEDSDVFSKGFCIYDIKTNDLLGYKNEQVNTSVQALSPCGQFLLLKSATDKFKIYNLPSHLASIRKRCHQMEVKDKIAFYKIQLHVLFKHKYFASLLESRPLTQELIGTFRDFNVLELTKLLGTIVKNG